jgi:hypothetical protein
VQGAEAAGRGVKCTPLNWTPSLGIDLVLRIQQLSPFLEPLEAGLEYALNGGWGLELHPVSTGHRPQPEGLGIALGI